MFSENALYIKISAHLFLLALDPYQRIRLVNWIRKEVRPQMLAIYNGPLTFTQKPAPSEVLALKGDESFFSSDEYLIPVLEDDPLLRESLKVCNVLQSLTMEHYCRDTVCGMVGFRG